jgi:hypothetical protein
MFTSRWPTVGSLDSGLGKGINPKQQRASDRAALNRV